MQADIDGKMNRELFKELGSNGLGLFGLTIPVEDGGAGMDAVASCIVHHELSRVDVGFCLCYLAHAMLFVNNLYWSATPEQRKKYIPGCLTGEKLGAMGMSEPAAGSDVLGMRTHAKKTQGGYILNGSKTWITNGPYADYFLVYAKNVEANTISSFIVERAMIGFSNSPKIDKVGNRASEMCTLYFDNIFIPDENLTGGNPNGLIGMMRNLELERVSGAAMSCGMGERCVEIMLQYANERKAFGQPIINYGQIQKYIAENFANIEAAKALTYAVARNVAPGKMNRIGTDASKLIAGPAAKKAADDAMQVLGGMGYARGMCPERLWRDAKLSEIGAGANSIMEKNLAKDLSNLMMGK